MKCSYSLHVYGWLWLLFFIIYKAIWFWTKFLPECNRGGDWNSGGGCHLETLPDLGLLPASSDIHFKTLSDMLTERTNESQVMKLDLLKVTNMTSRRKDGHASIYYNGPETGPASLHRQDCSHWCLPGVPDSWNELLYALLLKREFFGRGASTKPSQPPLWLVPTAYWFQIYMIKGL